MKQIILVTVFMFVSSLSYAQSNVNGGDEKFYGTFFMESYPVKGCEIVKLAPAEQSSSSFINFEDIDFKKSGNYSGVLHDVSINLMRELEKKVQGYGYNAVIGAKFNNTIDYHGTTDFAAINGKRGYGIGMVMIIGHPAIIKCK